MFVPEMILRKAGFSVFLPVKKIWRQKHRFTTEQELVDFPIMTDWLLVGWSRHEARWRDLEALGVVTGVLGSGGRPIMIPSATVSLMMRRWGGGVVQRRRRGENSLDGLNAGDSVDIVAGSFAGFNGTIAELIQN